MPACWRKRLVSLAGTLNTVLYTIDLIFARSPCEPSKASPWPRHGSLSCPRRPAQQKPRLQAIDGFMIQGVFTELDSEQMKHRLSLAEIEKSHFDGISTDIQGILTYMARSEKLALALPSRSR